MKRFAIALFSISTLMISAQNQRVIIDADTGNEVDDLYALARILLDPSINCIIELMGGITDAKDVVFKAIQEGKHVITANKALIAHYMSDIMTLLQMQDPC